MGWQLGAITNAVIMTAYFSIAFALYRSLRASGQLRTNRLGMATTAIFFTCGVGHGAHLWHLLVPALDPTDPTGLAARSAHDLHIGLVDLATAGAGLWYWTLRSHYRRLLKGPKLFEDLQARRRQAVELNDSIIQSLTVATYALDSGDVAGARAANLVALEQARGLVADLLEGAGTSTAADALVRATPAEVLSALSADGRLAAPTEGR